MMVRALHSRASDAAAGFLRLSAMMARQAQAHLRAGNVDGYGRCCDAARHWHNLAWLNACARN